MGAGITRSLRFAHYATYDILSRDPSETTWIPKAPIFVEGDVAFIERHNVQPITDAFIYVFEDGPTLRKRNPTAAVGTTSPFLLLGVIRIDADGEYFLSTRALVKGAAEVGSTPFFVSMGANLSLPGEVQQVEEEMYFLVSRTLLPLATIDKLEAARPPQLPLVKVFDNAHFAMVTDGPQSPQGNEWVVFAVDPITIAENFNRIYYDKSDAFLSLTQPYDKLDHEPNKEAAERQNEARIRHLQKSVADTIKGMLQHATDDKLKERIRDAANIGALDAFLEDFERDLDEAIKERERAAHDLIHWIRSELWLLIDESYREGASDGAVGDEYSKFLAPLSQIFARLGESDPGVAYMMELLLELDVEGEPKATIPNVFALNEFILRGDGAVSDAAKLTSTIVGCGAGFVGAWGSFVNLVHAFNMEKLRTGKPEGRFGGLKSPKDIPSPMDGSLLGRSTFRMAQTLNRAYGFEVVEVLAPSLVVEFLDTRGGQPAIVTKIEMLDVHYGIVDEGAKKLTGLAGKVTQASLAKVLSILNVGLASYSLQEGLAKNQSFRDNAFTVVDFTQSVLDFASNTEAFVAFWQRLNGKVDLFGQPLLSSKLLAGYFGLLGSVLSLASATNRAIQDYETKDFDAFVGNGVQGVGAVLSGIGAALIIDAGFTGPAAGWFLFAGAVVSIGGYIFTAFADDEDIEILVKFSAFGKFAGEAAPAPDWAIAPTKNFSDWNPETEVGLFLQLEAFQNVFFAFVVSGVSGAPDTLRIFPSGLRKDSIFDISFTARYDSLLPSSVPANDPRRLGHQRSTRVRVDPDALTLEVSFGAALITAGHVTRSQVDGRDVIDVRVEPDPTGDDKVEVVSNPRLRRLEANVTLDVYGDGGSRFIPSNRGGDPLTVPLVVFDATKIVQEGAKSSTDFHA